MVYDTVISACCFTSSFGLPIVTTQIAREHPFLEEYNEAWPVDEMVKQHLLNTRKKASCGDCKSVAAGAETHDDTTPGTVLSVP